MPVFSDRNYRKYLLPKRLVFFDLDGTIIPSTSATGRRIAIAMSTYRIVRDFARNVFHIDNLPEVNDEVQCSEWYRTCGGAHGLIRQILGATSLQEDIKDCLGFYFTGLFNRRLTQYHEMDLQYDWVPGAHLDFLVKLAEHASLLLVSYRYQTQFDFLTSIETLGLTRGGLFGPNNAFAVGGPGTSSDGSKSRFVLGMWRNEIRAQSGLVSDIGKSFPPIVVGDSIRDIHFSAEIGAIFFGVSETGEDSREILVEEIRNLEDSLNTRSRVFPSLANDQLQRRLLEECAAYRETIRNLKD